MLSLTIEPLGLRLLHEPTPIATPVLDAIAPPARNTHRLTLTVGGREVTGEYPDYATAVAFQVWWKQMGYAGTISEIGGGT